MRQVHALCVVSVVVRAVAIDSRNRLVLCGQLYIADCKDEGNTLKPHLPEKKTVAVLKMLVLERVWAPSLAHVSTLDVTHVIKYTRL